MATQSTGSLSMYGNTLQYFGTNSGLDTNALIEAELAVLQARNTPLTTQQTYYKQEKDAWTSLKSNMSTFTNTLDQLKKLDFNSKQVKLGQTGYAEITASQDAIQGNYNLTIQQIATNHKVMSDKVQDPKKPLGIEGTVKINGEDFAFTQDMTMNDVANKINKGDYKTDAVVINGHLILTSRETGEANKLVFTEGVGNTPTAVSSDATTAAARVVGAPDPGTNNYVFNVTQLASKQQNLSDAVADVNAPLGYNGSFDVGGATVSFSASDSLQDVVNNINGSSSSATATIENGKLVLTGKNTGNGNGFALDSFSGDSQQFFESIGMVNPDGTFKTTVSSAADASYTIDGASYTSSDNIARQVNGVEVDLLKANGTDTTITTRESNGNILESLGILTSAGTYKNETQIAKDAQFEIDGIPMTSAQNRVTTALSGVTIELTKPTTSEVTFSVLQDQQALKDKVQAFVDSYNSVINKINTLTGKGAVLQGQSTAMRAKMDMNSIIYNRTGSNLKTYEIGIEIDGSAKNGTIKFNSSKLQDQLEKNPSEVMKLISGNDSVVDNLYKRLNELTKGSGVIDSAITGLDKRIDSINDTLDRNEMLYEKQRDTLLKKMSNYETMMSSLNLTSQYMDAQLESLSQKS